MPRETQNKILRVLVDQTFQRVGGTKKVESTCASSRRPRATSRREIAAGKFREDLFHRLSVVPIRVPPLAERREDIPSWSTISWTRFRRRPACRSGKIGEDAMAVLQSHDWPGNVRQLRNNVERLMILAGGDADAVISAAMLPQDVGAMVPSLPNGDGGEHLMGAAAARRARNVRARVSARADQPLRRQHLAHRRVRRHGALGAAPQAQGAGNRVIW